jgi:hypothetical protein
MHMLDRGPGPSDEVDLVKTTSCGAVQQVIKQLARCSLLVARLLDRDAPRPNTASSFLTRFTTQECPVGVGFEVSSDVLWHSKAAREATLCRIQRERRLETCSLVKGQYPD